MSLSLLVGTTVVKSAYQKINFLISQLKHVKNDGYENIYNFTPQKLVYLNLWVNIIRPRNKKGVISKLIYYFTTKTYETVLLSTQNINRKRSTQFKNQDSDVCKA